LATKVFEATGRRKTSVARVRIRLGAGKKMINGRPLAQYLCRDSLVKLVEKPLEITGSHGKIDVICKAKGGGLSSQADAVRLGLSRALVKMDETYKKHLKKEGLLTRDPRMVERKKYGLVQARKRFQYSKR
jgi:small subunit ribosomal protein S9